MARRAADDEIGRALQNAIQHLLQRLEARIEPEHARTAVDIPDPDRLLRPQRDCRARTNPPRSPPALPKNIIAPIPKILPSTIPVKLERGVPGYAASELIVKNEKRIPETDIRHILIASTFVGALVAITDLGFDFDETQAALKASLQNIPIISSLDSQRALELVDAFHGFHIFRAEHPLDDWVTESWWALFQDAPYAYPSSMSDVVLYGLDIISVLEKCQVTK